LKALVSSRTQQDENFKIKIYNEDKSMIHMDDWEDLVQGGETYSIEIIHELENQKPPDTPRLTPVRITETLEDVHFHKKRPDSLGTRFNPDIINNDIVKAINEFKKHVDTREIPTEGELLVTMNCFQQGCHGLTLTSDRS